jgi:hypothetical protein
MSLISAHSADERSIHVPPGGRRANREAHTLTWDKRKLPHDLGGGGATRSPAAVMTTVSTSALDPWVKPDHLPVPPQILPEWRCAHAKRWLVLAQGSGRPKNRCSVSHWSVVEYSMSTAPGTPDYKLACSQRYQQVRRGAPGRIRTCAPASGGRVSPSTVVSLVPYLGFWRVSSVYRGHRVL